MSLDETIQIERNLIEAIRRSSRRMSLPIILILLKTFAVPFLVFIAAWIASSIIRSDLDTIYPDSSLNTITNLLTMLVTLALTWLAWRWTERRFAGLRLIRGLVHVSRAIRRVEGAILATRQTRIPAPEDLTEIDRLAHTAWDTYVQTMRAAGLSVPGGE